MAERDDLDLVMHLGDYVYDFADSDEYVRVPGSVPGPSTREEWRELHMRYLSDPDLRLARAAHPWFAIWDNHDVAGDNPGIGIAAFREFLPTREVAPNEELTVWRTMQLGDLVEMLFLDAELFQVSEDEAMATGGTARIITTAQHSQFADTMRASSARWRLIGTQKIMATVFAPDGLFPGGVIDPGSWMGYPADQERIYDVMDEVGNNVVVSGDLHFTFAPNLRRGACEPTDTDPSCAVAVELLPAGISRGGIDETVCSGMCTSGGTRLVEGIVRQLYALNPQVSFFDGIQHGYGVLTFEPSGVTGEVWYSPIREIALDEVMGVQLHVADGAREWERRFPVEAPPPL